MFNPVRGATLLSDHTFPTNNLITAQNILSSNHYHLGFIHRQISIRLNKKTKQYINLDYKILHSQLQKIDYW